MALKENTMYSVVANPTKILGYILNNEFYGTHFSEKGPININAMDGFVVEDSVMRRLKDSVEFNLIEVEDIE